MVTQIQQPNFLGNISQGMQLRDMMQRRQDRAGEKKYQQEQRGFLQEKQQRQRQKWGQEDEDRGLLQKKLQQKKDEKAKQDLYTTASHMDLSMSDEDLMKDYGGAVNWYAGENPEDMSPEVRQEYLNKPVGEVRAIIQQWQNAMGIKPIAAKDTRTTAIKEYEYGQKKPGFLAAQQKEAKPEQWQPWGYGQMRNKTTGDIKDVQVAPRKNETIRSLPGGGIEIIRKDEDGKTKPLKFTEQQAKTGGFATRIEAANKIMDVLEDSVDFEPTSIRGKIAESVPYIGNLLTDENRQVYNQGKMDFITAALRLESGAAISDQEFERDDKKYFPQPGDGPKVIANKRALRKRQFDIMSKSSGGAYDAITKASKAEAAANRRAMTIEDYPTASEEDLENIFRGQ